MPLVNINLTVAEGRVTWKQRDAKSVIGYILVNEKARRRENDEGGRREGA